MIKNHKGILLLSIFLEPGVKGVHGATDLLSGSGNGKLGLKNQVKVYAIKDDNKYPTKRKISDNEMKKINFTLNKTLGKWNYTIKPKR